jgi:hypothetical protein
VVDVSGDLDARTADADDALDDIHDARLQAGLGGLLRVLGRGSTEALGVRTGRQGAVGGVGQGDLFGLQIGHRGGDDVADGLDLGTGQLAAADADDHRGGGFSGIGLEQLAARQGDHDPGGIDAAHGQDGAGQLALEGPLFIEVLLELGLAQDRLAVEDFVADRAGGDEALAGDQHTRLTDFIAAHEDGRAVSLGGIFDAGGVEGGGDLGGLLQVEVGVQQGVGGLADAQHDGDQHGRDAGGDAQHHGQPTDSESLQRRREAAHASRPEYSRVPTDARWAENAGRVVNGELRPLVNQRFLRFCRTKPMTFAAASKCSRGMVSSMSTAA